MLNEIWTPIPGFSGYFASNLGRIGSKKQLTASAGHIRIMKYVQKSDGAKRYSLRCDGRYCTITGQRLVALTYVPNPENLQFVRHIDDNLHSDAPSNIEWCTGYRQGKTSA